MNWEVGEFSKWCRIKMWVQGRLRSWPGVKTRGHRGSSLLPVRLNSWWSTHPDVCVSTWGRNGACPKICGSDLRAITASVGRQITSGIRQKKNFFPLKIWSNWQISVLPSTCLCYVPEVSFSVSHACCPIGPVPPCLGPGLEPLVGLWPSRPPLSVLLGEATFQIPSLAS